MSGESVELATAYVSLVPSLQGAQGRIAEELGVAGEPAGKQLGGGIVTGLKGALGPVAALMAGVFSVKAAGDWGVAQIDSLKRIETINAQTASAINATGGAAGVTAAHVEELAGKLEDLTATEAESTQEGANLLLTFKNIRNEAGAGNDIFDQATTSLVDMARAMGQEPAAAAVQLGKALNDPVAGIAALSRVGIQFTDDQKALIGSLVESGQTMEAQKIILAELNSQFGGSGAAYAATTAGQVELLGHAWGTFGEQVFSVAMPAVGAIASGLTDFLNGTLTPFVANVQEGASVLRAAFTGELMAEDSFLPLGLVQNIMAFGEGARGLWEAVSPLVGQLVELWSSLSPVSILFGALAPLLPQIAGIVTDLASAVGGSLTVALQGILGALQPVAVALSGHLTKVLMILLPIVADLASTLAGVLGQALMALAPVVAELAGAVGGVLAQVLTALSPLLSMVAQLIGQVLGAVLPLLDPVMQLAMAFLPLLTPIVELVGALLTPLIGLLTALLEPILGLITPLVELLAGALGVVINVLATVIGWVVQGISWFLALVTGSEQAGAQLNAVWTAVGQWFSDVWNGIVNGLSTAIGQIGSFLGGIWDTVMGALGGIGTWLIDSGAALIQGFIDGILGMVDGIGDAIGGVMDFVGGFFPNSPAKHGPLSGTGWTRIEHGGTALVEQFGAGMQAASLDSVFADVLAVPDVAALAPTSATLSLPASSTSAADASPGQGGTGFTQNNYFEHMDPEVAIEAAGQRASSVAERFGG